MSDTLSLIPPGKYEVFKGSAGGFRVTVVRPLSAAFNTDERSDNLPPQGQPISEQEGKKLARRRYQTGSLQLRGKKEKRWVARWREDVIEAGQIRRVNRSEIIGTLRDFPTRKLAARELQSRLATVNDPRYRARPTSTFREFSARWESTVLSQHKPSTQSTIRSQLRKHLVPFFGDWKLREIGPEEVQRFISSVKANPKTVKNLFAAIQMLWKSARAWNYVAHDAVSGVVLPKRVLAQRRFFTIDEIKRILTAAPEPYHTFYWLAAETGMRAGELCGLRIEDFDLERGFVGVNQSVWRGKFQSPKSGNAIRAFALSPQLVVHIAEFIRRWSPSERTLLFATRKGTPWDANLLVKRKLRPLLMSLGIAGGGLHAFRHANSTIMDRLGVPLKVRQQRLGHSDPTLTLDVYTHMVSEDDVRFAAQLGEILHPIAPKLNEEGVALAEQPLLN